MEKGQYLDGACAREETLPEISSCAGSGTSPCLAFWRGPDDRLLKIVTTGEPQPAVIDGSAWATEAELKAMVWSVDDDTSNEGGV